MLDSRFKIDGKTMPKPSSINISNKIISSSAERIAATGELVVTYLRTVREVVWTYKYLTSDEYDILYNAYIKSVIDTGIIYRTVETLDSNNGNQLTINTYTQDNFNAPLYRINNGERQYVNVELTFVER